MAAIDWQPGDASRRVQREMKRTARSGDRFAGDMARLVREWTADIRQLMERVEPDEPEPRAHMEAALTSLAAYRLSEMVDYAVAAYNATGRRDAGGRAPMGTLALASLGEALREVGYEFRGAAEAESPPSGKLCLTVRAEWMDEGERERMLNFAGERDNRRAAIVTISFTS